MNRLTRSQLSLLNSPDSHRFFTTITTKLPLRHPQTTFNFSHSIYSRRKFPQIITFATKKLTNPIIADPNRNPMDPNPSKEDFVHIESPSNNDNHLSESIVDVANELSEDDNKNDVVMGRKELPEELSRSVMVLTCESKAEGGTCVVHLVGTAHVSQESCREVQAVVSYLKPQVVFLELCASRVAVLTPQNLKVPTMGEMIEMWKKNHNTFGILYSWFLAKVSDKLEVFPGSEFRVAFEEARKYEGKVVLGDRPVQITLQRTWGKMPLWHKVKLLYSLLFQALFLPSSEDLDKMLKEMDDVDMLTLVIQEMSKQFPTLMDTLVHERDQYMSSTLLRIAKEHTSVVAVVGKGHLQGIKKHWGQPFEMKDLMEIPSQKPAVSARKVLASLGVAVAGVAIVSGFYLSRKK
uniref:TraB family protein n=2 Tax=Saliceae TaxID=238069 RepID=A0A2K1ZT81_POPTR|eukprot:XP_002310462.3 traB domain-containing protein isoform X1 [Populus trichocarpa]